MKPLIPLTALTGDSELALISVKTNTRKYSPDGTPIEGQAGDPRLEVVVMNTLEKQSVSVKTLPTEIANISPEQIEKALQTRQYILIEFDNATASPYANRSGFGVSYSVKAESARLIKATSPTTAPKSKNL